MLQVTLRVEEATAREIYRSLVPEERWLVVPPPGLLLPQAGQEPLPRPRPPREVPRLVPPASETGVPFQIPPPVDGGQPPPGIGPVPPEAAPEAPLTEPKPAENPTPAPPPEPQGPGTGEDR